MQAAITWILALLTYAAPPDRLSDAMPGWEESPEARRARYEAIAADIAATVYAPDAPALYGGARGRAHTAALLVAVAVLESGLAADVDRGPCYRGRDGRGPRCDSGRAYSLWQVHDASVAGDRRKAAARALRIMRSSFAWAHGTRDYNWSPAEREVHRLDAYAGGTNARAHRLAAARLAFADRLAARPGAPRDSEVAP